QPVALQMPFGSSQLRLAASGLVSTPVQCSASAQPITALHSPLFPDKSFAYLGTAELADELLIQAESAKQARRFAKEYAAHWGIELFSITQATKQQVHLYKLLGRSVLLSAA
ncbi:hypothetical protein, partial [Thermoleptolyngbya sp.]